MRMVGSTDVSVILRNLLAARLAVFCFDPDSDPFQFILRLDVFARLGLYIFPTGTVHLQELPGHSQQNCHGFQF